jgi:hypothetical protein
MQPVKRIGLVSLQKKKSKAVNQPVHNLMPSSARNDNNPGKGIKN